MDLPIEVRDAFVDILRNAILRIRIEGWGMNPDFCAVEADHVHNLPGLLVNFNRGALGYYLDAERPSHLEHCKHLNAKPTTHTDSWRRLDEYAATHPE